MAQSKKYKSNGYCGHLDKLRDMYGMPRWQSLSWQVTAWAPPGQCWPSLGTAQGPEEALRCKPASTDKVGHAARSSLSWTRRNARPWRRPGAFLLKEVTW